MYSPSTCLEKLKKEHENLSLGGRDLGRNLVKISVNHLMCTRDREA